MLEHSKLNLCFFIAICVMLQTCTLVLCKPQVPCFFIFGDSLVDNGNNNLLNTTVKVNLLPYGIDFPDGPTGRFTNGRNIADVIAGLLGFDKYIPPFANATNEEIITGVNYGSGGSGILEETGRQNGDVISLNDQLTNHKTVIQRIAKSMGSRLVAGYHLRKCIYYVGMGSNDYLNYFPELYTSQSPYTPEQFATLLINKYSKHLRSLYSFGARKVAVFELSSLGCIPQQLITYGATDGSSCFETSNDAVLIFNEKLKLLIHKLNNQLLGAKFLYTAGSSISSHGNITNLIDPCCKGWTSTGLCLPEAELCSNRDEYSFWDLFHPTEAANLISGKVAYTNMSPLYANLIDVW